LMFWPLDKNDDAIHVDHGFVKFVAANVVPAKARVNAGRCMVGGWYWTRYQCKTQALDLENRNKTFERSLYSHVPHPRNAAVN
jgi:hypothetical protein